MEGFIMLGIVVAVGILAIVYFRIVDKKFLSKKQLQLRKPRLYVFAGTHQQFNFWCNMNKEMVEHFDCIYISNVHTLYGVDDINITFFGTYNKRNDYWDIIYRLRAIRINRCY
jgi:hypothetical protein